LIFFISFIKKVHAAFWLENVKVFLSDDSSYPVKTGISMGIEKSLKKGRMQTGLYPLFAV
jgi:hypothetical protein